MYLKCTLNSRWCDRILLPQHIHTHVHVLSDWANFSIPSKSLHTVFENGFPAKELKQLS